MNINKLWFPWKPAQFRLGTISENACLGVHYQCAKFHACIKKCTIRLKFQVMPPDYILSLLKHWKHFEQIIKQLLNSAFV